MTETHPFAQYVRILGWGRTLSRSLTFEEAEVAMGMILRDEILTEQLGATCLLQGIFYPRYMATHQDTENILVETFHGVVSWRRPQD